MEDEDTIRAAKLLRDDEVPDGSGVDDRRASTRDPSGYYARLGVSRKATQQEIRRAFLFLSQRYHTDKHASQGDMVQNLMNERFQELQDAYIVLSDERQRAAYDAGGDTGIQRLALVPAGLYRREDIVSYVLSLERESQLLRTAQLLSATSQATMNFSTAHLFSFPSPVEATGRSSMDGEDGDSGAERGSHSSHGAEVSSEQPQLAPPPRHGKQTAVLPTAALDTSSYPDSETAAAAPPAPTPTAAPLQSKAHPVSSAAASEGKEGAPPASAAAVEARLTAKEVVIDGQRHIVLIPNQEVQRQLRQRMLGLAAGEATASSPPGGRGGAMPRATLPGHRLSLSQAIMLAVVPKSMTLRSSFQHSITPRLSLTFRTDGTARMQKATTSLTTTVKYCPDDVRTYETSLRMAVQGLKWCVMQARALNPLWTLRAKLTLLSSMALLQKLELSLARKMSATAELENVLAMSLTDHGYFRCSFNNFTEDVQQGLITHMAFHNMYVTAFTGKKVVLGVDTKDPKHPPTYGQIQYSVNFSPLARQSTFGFEAWYIPSKTQRYGLAFAAVLPYAVSPIAPPPFLVQNTQLAVVNQISILYARGRHRITVPVIVCISPKVSHGLMWLSAPLALYRIGSMLYRPYARAKAIRYYTEQRQLHIAEMDVAREKARMEQLALESLVLMGRAKEERKGGLVIINARYGVLEPQFAEITSLAAPTATTSLSEWWPSRFARRLAQGCLRRRHVATAPLRATKETEAQQGPTQSDPIPLSIDVTIAVQNLVRDSALTLPAGTKSSLVGFCNPDPYTPELQKLKIVYWFRKRKHMAVFDDEEEVELPQREHLIKS
ncbi:hypothetical protein LSCM1_04100 [Leishmania martiniquensis]|uniref:J domain-containing protein n=1 Tax=Leishmania martiniquensis TaxID=1580590 RepID=A0A836G6Z5_9TRYP|nr:hypothetical protein LSCM1_04100 [Leishmania martiniquensis]